MRIEEVGADTTGWMKTVRLEEYESNERFAFLFEDSEDDWTQR